MSQDPNQWAMNRRGYDNQRFSPLNQINAGNVKNLKMAYVLSLGTTRSRESTPIIIGDTIYVSSSWGPKFVYAADAKTGKVKWRYEPELPDDMMPYACRDVNSRGVTYANGMIFVGRLDGQLIALDVKTGKEKWKTKVVDYTQGSVITSPTLAIKNIIVTGYGGGEYGARGALIAYDQLTGTQVWKFNTVPAPNEAGGDTWKGDAYKFGGGSAWNVDSYDPKTNTVFWGTSNPGPWNTSVRGPGSSDYGRFTNLYTTSTIALDRDTGKLKFYLQHTPHDAWDYDGVNEIVLADLNIGGLVTPAMMKADRNGFFYVANRERGKLISPKKFIYANWADKIDLATTRPVEVVKMRPTATNKAEGVCPNWVGGKNWQPMSFNPNTGLVYMNSNNICMSMKDIDVEYKRGQFYLGKDFAFMPSPPQGTPGPLVAWDPVAQKNVWSIDHKMPLNGGTLSTGGNLVFYGDMEGQFNAVDAKSGKKLWSFNVSSCVGPGAATFMIDGKQYIAIVVGRTVTIPAFIGAAGKAIINATPEGGMMFVFSL